MEKGLTNSSIVEIISAHNGTSLFNEEGVAIEYEFLAKNIEKIGKQLSSIDIKNNKCVRLSQGKEETSRGPESGNQVNKWPGSHMSGRFLTSGDWHRTT